MFVRVFCSSSGSVKTNDETWFVFLIVHEPLDIRNYLDTLYVLDLKGF